MYKEPRCEECKFYFPLKEFKDGDWILKNVCCLFPITDGGRDSFALVVVGNDKCEMFEERNNNMNVTMTRYPTADDWAECKRRALVTSGKLKLINPPSDEWKHKILRARHSPIRYLQFSFLLEDIPYWVSVHLVRHVHSQPYVRSQRNDRQNMYDRNDAPQSSPVTMIWDMNAEELMNIANKRLCRKASPETRKVVQVMCNEAVKMCPEFEPFLVPNCAYLGKCHEMYPCDAGM